MAGPRVTQGARVPLFDRLGGGAEPDLLRAPRETGVVVAGRSEAESGRAVGLDSRRPESLHREDDSPVTPIRWSDYRAPEPRPAPSAGREAPRLLDRDGLAASIARELDRLLNTRTPLSVEELERRPRSTLDYGLPDLSLFWPLNPHSEAHLVALITDTVAAFEPRLRNPWVRVERIPGPQRSLRALVGGEIALGGMVERVTFPVRLGDSAADPADSEPL